MEDKKFLAYSASAGSGKTYALALRYIALLFMGQKPSEILAATFTKKAASEMQQRVLKLLKNLDTQEDFLNSLTQEYGLSKEEILTNKERVLNLFLKSQNYIVTLDSFFNSILRSSALQIGLEPDFAIKQKSDESLNENFLKELEQNDKMDSLVKLSLNLQKRKSEDITELLSNLFAIDALLPNINWSLQNIDSAKEKIEHLRVTLLNAIKNSGAPNRAVNLFDNDDFKKLITQNIFEKESMAEHTYYKKYATPEMETLFKELKSEISAFHNALESTIFYYLFEIYDRYKSVRIDEIKYSNELGFTDILYFTHRLLSSEITKEFLYFKLDTKFKHILLDEFQDTSALQYLILEPMIKEILSGVGQSEFRTFFYVGDVKQSLYRFRGGVEELFEYIAKKHHINLKTLDTNYRSAKLLVEYVNSVFVEKIPNFVKQKAKKEIDGFVEVISSEDLKQKAKERVEHLIEQGVELKDIAVLVFANKDGVALQEYLKSFNIESVLKTSSSLKFNQKIAALVGVLEYLLSGEQIFLEPFKQKLGLENNLNLEWFKPYMSPFEVLERVIKEYGYFGGDLNILKLLDYARSFSTIEEFLDEFKDSNIELAKNSINGLQIMTIHGSKGLEFKYVIVLDRFGKGAPNRDLMLFKNANPIKIEKIYYKYSKKEHFIKDYATTLEQEKAMSGKDKMNLLYVALTRAELGMSIIQKEKASEFKVLKLEPIQKGKIIVEDKKEIVPLKSLSSTISSYGKQEVESVETQDDTLMDYNALSFGEALHYAMEMLDFNNSDSLELAIEAVVNRYGSIIEAQEIAKIKKRVENVFECQEFYDLINGTKIYKEQPIVYKEKFYQIDLLAKREDVNLIFDYKSSRKFENKHIEQVSNYCKALKEIDNRDSRGYIIYLLESRVEMVRV